MPKGCLSGGHSIGQQLCNVAGVEWWRSRGGRDRAGEGKVVSEGGSGWYICGGVRNCERMIHRGWSSMRETTFWTRMRTPQVVKTEWRGGAKDDEGHG